MGPAKYREMLFGNEARKKIKEGVDKAANAIKVTLGVTGKSVVVEDPLDQTSPIIMDDGVSVAKSIILEDRFENLGASLIQEVANKTNDTAGDGTSTATVLAQAMLSGAFDAMTRDPQDLGHNNIQPMELKEQMAAAIDKVKAELLIAKRDCTLEDIEKVATISSLDPEVGKIIADVFKEVGNDGVISLESSQKVGMEKEVVMGLRFSSGYVSPYLVNNPQKDNMLVNSPVIFVTDEKIHHNEDVTPILDAALQDGHRDVVIICNDMDGEALTTVLANEIHLMGPGGKQGSMTIGVIKAPFFGPEQEEFLQDVATITGATVFTKKTGMKYMEGSNGKVADKKWFGKAHRVVIQRHDTTIIEGGGDKTAITKRSEDIRQLLKDNPNFDSYDVKRHEKRIANLIGGIGLIKVGAYTQTELQSRLYKIEDALNAAKAAIKEGIIIGGGSALAKIGAAMLPSEIIGEQIVAFALGAPLKQMAENKGLDVNKVANEVVADTTNPDTGYDFKTNELCNLFERGVVDPVKITRLALENAYSIVSTIISAEAALISVREEEKKNA